MRNAEALLKATESDSEEEEDDRDGLKLAQDTMTSSYAQKIAALNTIAKGGPVGEEIKNSDKNDTSALMYRKSNTLGHSQDVGGADVMGKESSDFYKNNWKDPTVREKFIKKEVYDCSSDEEDGRAGDT